MKNHAVAGSWTMKSAAAIRIFFPGIVPTPRLACDNRTGPSSAAEFAPTALAVMRLPMVAAIAVSTDPLGPANVPSLVATVGSDGVPPSDTVT